MRILVTGANGFVGRHVVERIATDAQMTVVAAARRGEFPAGVRVINGPDLNGTANWREALRGSDVVIHCAGRAHVSQKRGGDPDDGFRRVNVQGTIALARQASDAGVRRLVFVSSIGVNGIATKGLPFAVGDAPLPCSPYAQSKYDAECSLTEMAEKEGLEVVIVRPPLVFGPNAPGNLHRLASLVRTGLPLPFASVKNRRSLISVENLADLLICCASHPAAAGRIFLAGDGPAVSTPEIIRHVGRSIGVEPRLLPCPPALVKVVLLTAGKKAVAEQLLGSLEVDWSAARDTLNWTPRYDRTTVRWA